MSDLLKLTKELKTIKAEVEKIKVENSKLEGRKEQLLMTLKTEFGVDTVEQAKDKLLELTKQYELTTAEALEIFKHIQNLYSDIKKQ